MGHYLLEIERGNELCKWHKFKREKSGCGQVSIKHSTVYHLVASVEADILRVTTKKNE